MTKYTGKRKNSMIYSPNHHIPLGQTMKIAKGEYRLRVKKDNGTYEVIPIGKLMAEVIQTAEAEQQ